MKNKISCILFLSFFLNQFIQADVSKYKNVEQQKIANPQNKENEIEFFYLKPEGKGPFPIIFLLHGYQTPEKSIGGKQLLEYGYLERFANEGVVAVSISVPGNGNSTGKRDFGGLDSQKAIIAIIDHFKTQTFIDSSKIGIYGISRGAQLAGMVASQCPDISLQILESGFYDLISFCSDAPQYLEGIKNNLVEEGGNTLEALIERSPVYHADSMQAATLILQGEFDDRKQLPAAKMLHTKLINLGIESALKIFPGELHGLPAEKWDTITPFVRQHFLNLYGIGIKVSDPIPALQILKIHPGFSAFKSGKLKVGDVILRISPMNDDNEINALQMPMKEFVPLILGNKGTYVRLHVQHFDLSFEDIIIQRDSHEL
jgi:dienelactone hydrolase